MQRGVWIAGNSTLFLAPTKDGHGPRWPALCLSAIRTWEGLVFQVKQTHVPQCRRTEAADFQIVLQQCQRLAHFIGTG